MTTDQVQKYQSNCHQLPVVLTGAKGRPQMLERQTGWPPYPVRRMEQVT